MAKLILKSGEGAVVGEFSLDKDRIVIGRKAGCDIQVGSSAVSGRHAEIINVLGDVFVEDLGSTNGTFVNGTQVKKLPLRHGDLVKVGDHCLEFLDESADADVDVEDDDFDNDKTVIIKHRSAEAAHSVAKVVEKAGAGVVANVDANVARPALNSGKMPMGRLVILSGPIAGKELRLDKPLVTLGKPGTQVAAISRRPQGYFLAHIESDGDGKRYPLVNGKPIGERAYELKDSDVIELAGIKMTFVFS